MSEREKMSVSGFEEVEENVEWSGDDKFERATVEAQRGRCGGWNGVIPTSLHTPKVHTALRLAVRMHGNVLHVSCNLQGHRTSWRFWIRINWVEWIWGCATGG